MICEVLSRKTKKETRLKYCKVVAVPVLLYGSETWVAVKKRLSRIKALEMRFFHSVKGCIRRDRLDNEDIHKELKTVSYTHLDVYKRQGIQYLEYAVHYGSWMLLWTQKNSRGQKLILVERTR